MPPNPNRILLCGVGPLPFGNDERLFAPGLRLLGFSEAILERGVDVDVLEVRFGETGQGAGAHLHAMGLALAEAPGARPRLRAETAPLAAAAPAELVAGALAAKHYDALAATTDVMCEACARTAGDLPLWCDYNGPPMVERQSLSTVYDSDDGLAAQWDMLLAPLLRGDRFSTCGEAQRLALLGELGACGRLNRLTDGRPLADALHPAVRFDRPEPSGRRVRGELFPADAFAVLWTGGYNTWADAETLAAGLLEAMRRVPRLHYVSTGGALEGHDDRTFARFREAVQASPEAERFHFAGWVPTREVPDFYLQCDLAVNCDRPTLEGELGCRNRILEWAASELPVLSTNLCELTHDLAVRGLIDVFATGDPTDLTTGLLRAAGRDAAAARRRAASARDYLVEAYAPSRRFAPLAEWCAAPRRAPDLSRPAGEPGVPFGFPDNALARRRAREWRETWKPTGPAGRLLRKLRS